MPIVIATIKVGLAWYLSASHGILFLLSVGIAVPCALGWHSHGHLATRKGAEHGVLTSGGEKLETAHKIKTIAFAK